MNGLSNGGSFVRAGLQKKPTFSKRLLAADFLLVDQKDIIPSCNVDTALIIPRYLYQVLSVRIDRYLVESTR